MLLDTKRVTVAMTLILLATGSWWLSRSVKTPIMAFDSKPRHEPDYTIDNFSATVMNAQGQRRYSLSAEILLHYADDGSSALNKPYLIQYPAGNPPVHTRADKGWMPQDSSQILMTGHVQVAQGRDPKTIGREITAESIKIILNKTLNEAR